MEHTTGIARAVATAGGQEALADMLGCTQQAVSTWVVRGFAPPKRARAIAEITGLPARELCDPALVKLIED